MSREKTNYYGLPRRIQKLGFWGDAGKELQVAGDMNLIV